jgi:ferredoxin
MPTVTFKQAGKTVEANNGDWLVDVVEGAGIGIPFSCRAGNCGSCATEVLEGGENLTKQTGREGFLLQALGVDTKHYRLLCMTELQGDVVLGKQLFTAPRPMD